jgi:hypothetical protein
MARILLLVDRVCDHLILPTAQALRAFLLRHQPDSSAASWQEMTPSEYSHDSRTYTTRFMLRLDEPSQTKLEQLIRQLGVSKADIIRQLIAQAKPEDFPPSWQMRATERRAQQPRR